MDHATQGNDSAIVAPVTVPKTAWLSAWQGLGDFIEMEIARACPGSERQETCRGVLFAMNSIEMRLVEAAAADARETEGLRDGFEAGVARKAD